MYSILITSVGGGLACHLFSAIKRGKFKDLRIVGANNIKNSLLNFDVQKDIKLSKDLVDNFISTIQNNSNANNKEKNVNTDEKLDFP